MVLFLFFVAQHYAEEHTTAAQRHTHSAVEKDEIHEDKISRFRQIAFSTEFAGLAEYDAAGVDHKDQRKDAIDDHHSIHDFDNVDFLVEVDANSGGDVKQIDHGEDESEDKDGPVALCYVLVIT